MGTEVPRIYAASLNVLQFYNNGAFVFCLNYGLYLCLLDLNKRPSSEGRISPMTSRIS